MRTMSDRANREWLRGFIESYKQLPCLWQTKHRHYTDKNRRNAAYDRLIEKYREIEPEATRDTVTKKINSIRTVYKKELAKVRKSEAMYIDEDDIYKPTLWYYPLLEFLADEGIPKLKQRSSKQSSTHLTIDGEGPVSVVECEFLHDGDSDDEEYGNSLYSPEDNEIPSSASSMVPESPSEKRLSCPPDHEYILKKARHELASGSAGEEETLERSRKQIPDATDMFRKYLPDGEYLPDRPQRFKTESEDSFDRSRRQSAIDVSTRYRPQIKVAEDIFEKSRRPIAEDVPDRCQRLVLDAKDTPERSQTHIPPAEDTFDRYGKHIADRLRLINPSQIKFVQKIVSDVLFEAEMEKLDATWRVMTTKKEDKCLPIPSQDPV